MNLHLAKAYRRISGQGRRSKTSPTGFPSSFMDTTPQASPWQLLDSQDLLLPRISHRRVVDDPLDGLVQHVSASINGRLRLVSACPATIRYQYQASERLRQLSQTI